MSYNIFFIYIVLRIYKFRKNYQLNIAKIIRKDYKKKFVKARDFQNKKKSDKMVVNNTKIYQKMKSKSLLSIEKNIIK